VKTTYSVGFVNRTQKLEKSESCDGVAIRNQQSKLKSILVRLKIACSLKTPEATVADGFGGLALENVIDL